MSSISVFRIEKSADRREWRIVTILGGGVGGDEGFVAWRNVGDFLGGWWRCNWLVLVGLVEGMAKEYVSAPLIKDNNMRENMLR